MVEYPKVNSLVVCEVTKITNYGVFAELLEYDNLEGFIHISQVSSSWIKNIHNHAKINQIRAAKVLKIDTYKNHIDLSFNRISNADEKRKISEYRLFKRAQSLLTVIAKELGVSFDDAWDHIAEPLILKERNLYTGFVNFLKYGSESYDIDKKYLSKLKEVLEKNITIKDKTITYFIEVSCAKADAANIISDAFKKSLKNVTKCDVIYAGPGKYKMTVTAIDYKTAAKKLDLISKKLEKNFNNCNLNIIKDNKR